MKARSRSPWLVYVVGALFAALACVAIGDAVRAYSRPFASVLVDPDAVVSGIGSPEWAGLRAGLRFPDRVLVVDGVDLTRETTGYRGDVFDDAVARAAQAGHPAVHVVVQTRAGTRELDLPLRHFTVAEWWLTGGVLFIAAALYVVAALSALVASPRGPLARTFCKTALVTALSALTLFDFQTSRTLMLFWPTSLALIPGAFIALALRLPDDAPILRRAPWLVGVLDLIGVTLAGAMLLCRALYIPITPIQSACSAYFGVTQMFFVATVLVRFARAKGERRTVMRALIGAVAPVHALLGIAILLAMSSSRGSSAVFFVILPVLSLTPLSAVVAFLRHNLWGSRALVSRVVTLTVTASIACGLAVAVGSAFAALLGIPFANAVLGATAGAIASAGLVTLALRLADRGFFPAHAEYKPTVDKLSEHLTSITNPEEVARSVERTVKRWLACESVECIPRDPDDTPVAPFLGLDADRLTLPITFRSELVGILHVGKKRGGALFTSDDLDLLRTIANQAALGLAHARSYRELEDRRRQQAEAWRGERLALVETLAAEIAHEIRYPINYFRSVFQRGTEGALDAEDIEIGQEEVERLERLVSGLRRVTHHRLERRVVLIAELAARAEVLLRDALGSRTIDLSIPDGAALRADFDQATQVAVNLLANALDAAGPTGRVGLMWRERADGDGAHLIVWDTGPGFEGDASQLFAPWFTTKPRGTGLGLAITQRIVRAHSWSIDARRVDGRTHFFVHVPAADVVGLDEDDQPTEGEPLRH